MVGGIGRLEQKVCVLCCLEEEDVLLRCGAHKVGGQWGGGCR